MSLAMGALSQYDANLQYSDALSYSYECPDNTCTLYYSDLCLPYLLAIKNDIQKYQ